MYLNAQSSRFTSHRIAQEQLEKIWDGPSGVKQTGGGEVGYLQSKWKWRGGLNLSSGPMHPPTTAERGPLQSQTKM
jgi:hypothetical protein